MPNDVLEQVNSARLGFAAAVRYRVRLVASRIAHRVYALGQERARLVQSITDLRADLSSGREHRTGYEDHYTEARELEVWERYRKDFAEKTASESEIVFRAHQVRDEVLRVLAKDPSIRNFVNFGCSYGWLENAIAQEARGITVFGIDRSANAMQRNRDAFPRDNCRFIAADFFDFICENRSALENSIFCHVNIGVYFLPAFVSRIYDTVFESGARYIVLLEPAGMSRQINRYYQFGFDPRDSVVFRGVMLIHNYPALLRRSGFETIRAALLTPPHPHEDFRSVTFTAERSRRVLEKA